MSLPGVKGIKWEDLNKVGIPTPYPHNCIDGSEASSEIRYSKDGVWCIRCNQRIGDSP